MDTKILQPETKPSGQAKNQEALPLLHGNLSPEKAPGRPKPQKPRELRWFAVQAVKFDDDKTSPNYGKVTFRSFPFFCISLEHARQELNRAGDHPYTHIYQVGYLDEKARKYPVYKKEDRCIEIATGKRIR